MKLHFCKSNDIGGRLIRLFLFSQWNHAAIEVGGGVYESMARGGVRVTPAPGYGSRWHRAESIELAVPDEMALQAFLNRQVGKPYDWRALFALPFRKDWHEPNKWFCSELVAAALEQGGRSLRVKSSRVTPRDLWVAL
jgi:uncharacterized protein YycO